MKLQLDVWQKDFIDTKGDKILCCGRQIGKTEICAIDCGEYVQDPDNPHPVLMTAPTERQAYNLFDKTLRYLMDNYPKSIFMKGQFRPTKSKITLKDKKHPKKEGLRIFCLPTGLTGLGIRGITVGRSYEDENSRTPDEVESAIAPMLLITGGARIKLSTPYGARGEFWRTFINKDGAYDSYTRFSKDSETVIRDRPISDTWSEMQRENALRLIEQSKSRMSNKEFAQEWMGDFIEDLFRFFSDKLIKETCILKKPTSINKYVNHYLGSDIARMGEDEGTFEGIDRISPTNLQHVENIITNKKLTTDTHDKIIALDRIWNYNKQGIGIDAGSGSLGVGILDWLLRSNIKHKIVAINNLKRVLDSSGDNTTKLLKEDLYQNMLALMQRGVLKLLKDDDVIASLQSIQYEYVMKPGQPVKIRIFGNYSHIVEGLVRAAWLANQKHINMFISHI